MKSTARPPATFVISWNQTEIDGCIGAPVTALDTGAVWIWRGTPVQIDGATGFESVRPGETATARRLRAAAGARRVVARALEREDHASLMNEELAAGDRTFIVSDGHRKWVATLIELPQLTTPLVMFTGSMPPASAPLYAFEGLSTLSLQTAATAGTEGVVCFTPGTLLETPSGLRPVEKLVAGDRLITKDNGAQPIVWVGSRNVSGARLFAIPDLRPVRICEGALGSGRPAGDLTVSPDHRMLVSGPAARSLWGEDEVLVAARDLVDGHGIKRDMQAKSATYFHLMLEHHQVLVANGVETESFHPAAAALDDIEEDQRMRLYDVMPDLANDPLTYGPTSRRALSRREATLLPSAA